jgi:cysteinyl-tRNA synthetase
MLNVGGVKMSKSLGNMVTIRDALTNYTAEELRFFFANAHYRRVANFCKSRLLEARKSLESMRKAMDKLSACSSSKGAGKPDLRLLGDLSRTEDSFTSAMDHDFDTTRALKVLSTFLRNASSQAKTRGEFEANTCQAVVKRVLAMANVIGVFVA